MRSLYRSVELCPRVSEAGAAEEVERVGAVRVLHQPGQPGDGPEEVLRLGVQGVFRDGCQQVLCPVLPVAAGAAR